MAVSPDFFSLLGNAGGLIGGLAAAAGVIYTSLQLRTSINQNFSQALLDASKTFEDLENSKERNSHRNHENFAVRYFNHCERLAHLRYNNVISEKAVAFFEYNFKAAFNLLSLKEYSHYQDDFPYFMKWCNDKNISPYTKYKILPPENITIIPVLSGTKINNTGSQFYPEELKIGVNNFVVWKNNDIHPHRIKSIDDPVNTDRGEKFDSGDKKPLSLSTKGDLFAHRFTKIGEHHYYCKIHTNEKGIVTVKE